MSFTILLDGVDITSTVLSDGINIKYRERASAIATFKFKPVGSPLFPADLVRKIVYIGWLADNIYSGKVNNAEWDIKTRSYSIECSTFLQEEFEGKTNAEIEALLPGALYSEQIFGSRDDGWQYAQDLLASLPQDIYIHPTTAALTVVNWEADPAPHFLFNELNILNNGEYTLTLAKARDIITQYKVKYQYRISRWKRRTHNFSWSGLHILGSNTTWCDYLIDGGYTLPSRDAIISAASGAGWSLGSDNLIALENREEGIYFESYPDTGIYCTAQIPPYGIYWLTTDEQQQTTALAARWKAYKKWAQTITETYELVFNATAAQTTYGVVVQEENASYEVPVDDGSFETDDVASLSGDWAVDAIGDATQDQEDIVIKEADITVFWQMADTALRQSLRRNTVKISTPLNTTITQSHTAHINTNDIEASGKVSEIEHKITQDKQITDVTIAVSNGGGGSGDPIAFPGKPDTSPIHDPPDNSTTLRTRVGGCDDSADYDETWTGWTANFSATQCGGGVPTEEQKYPLKFVVETPDIEDEARDEVTGTSTGTYILAIPQDTLILK